MAGRILWIVLAALTASLGGCQLPQFFAALFAPDPGIDTKESEFTDLPKHSVAIVIYADQKILYEFPTTRADVTEMVREELQKNIKDIKVVDPRQVYNLQETNLAWDTLDKTQMGKTLGADYVLYITLVDFTTVEPGSADLYRGNLLAEVALYKTALPERQSRVWKCSDLSATFPEKDYITGVVLDDSPIRKATIGSFAVKLVRKFYKHDEHKETPS